MTKSAKSRGSYDPERTRQLLVDSAIKLFSERGFSGTSMQDIVAGAGVTKGAFYHHFESKEDVLKLIHDQFLEAQAQEMERIQAEFSSPVDQLRETIKMSVRSVVEYREHVAIFFQERRNLTGERAQQVRARRDEVDRQIADIIRRGQESGYFDRRISVPVAVYGWVGMSAWVYTWFRPGLGMTAEDVANQLAVLVLDGLLAENGSEVDPGQASRV
jgi:TetR/AcrR family transcriptional regulator, cholesterol catabolism regulator